MFVVNYNAYEGETEIFGMFSTFEDAEKWMKNDVNESIINCKSAGMIKDDTMINNSYDDYAEIEGVGRWEIIEITEVSSVK